MGNLKYRFTDKQQAELLKSMVIIVDTNEQENSHIIECFNKIKVKYEKRSLDFGDYSAYIPINPELGITTELQLDYVIERKAHLEELSSNFTTGRTQFENEFIRSNGKMAVYIERGCLLDIITNKYGTSYNSKSFLATLISFKQRYGVDFNFVDKKHIGLLIYTELYYKLRNEIR